MGPDFEAFQALDEIEFTQTPSTKNRERKGPQSEEPKISYSPHRPRSSSGDSSGASMACQCPHRRSSPTIRNEMYLFRHLFVATAVRMKPSSHQIDHEVKQSRVPPDQLGVLQRETARHVMTKRTFGDTAE
jgi:hypothetical protein